jgi:CPA1 family monovalent cation:H+ antiporter
MRPDTRQLEIIFLLLLLFVVIFGDVARRLKVAYPIVLVIGGLFLSFIPGLPRITLNPDLVFVVILPPLLYYAAWQTSWRDFRLNLVSILLLAFGLVTFTVVGVSLAAEWIFSFLYWRTGFVLGAIVAPTDALAATSIARRLGLPQRVTDILEGESLVNDASGLLALGVGITLVVNGHLPSVRDSVLQLLYLIFGGLAVGIAIGYLIAWVERHIDDAPIEMTLTLITPYAAYIAAQTAHASGILAVVACGLFLSRKSSEFFSPAVRLQANALWRAINFILNGLVFLLIGLQLPTVVSGLHYYTHRTLLIDAISFSAIVILLRLFWVYPGAYLSWLIRKGILKQDYPMPPPKQIFIVGWTGMRGVVSLAAALSLPPTIANGEPFPARDLIIFLTFSVILVTLVVQGLTLPPLIRALGQSGVESGPDCEENEARRLMLTAAFDQLKQARDRDDPEFAGVYNDIIEHLQDQLTDLAADLTGAASVLHFSRYRELSFEVLRIERSTALALRSSGRINDTVLHRLERELDLNETRLAYESRRDVDEDD